MKKTNLISGNEEEIFKKKRKIADLQDDIECMHEKISNATTVVDRYNKLKDLNSQLKTKHRSHKRLIKFLKKMKIVRLVNSILMRTSKIL